MMVDYIDDILQQNKNLSINLSAILKRTLRLTFRSNTFFLLIATLNAGIWQYESNFIYKDEIQIILSVFALLTWLYVSFLNGFLKHKKHIGFILLYWILPNAVIYLMIYLGSYNYITETYIIREICDLLVVAPVFEISLITRLSAQIVGAFISALSLISFLGGYVLRRNCGKSAWYRKFRAYHSKS